MIGYTVTVYIVHSWPLATKGIDWRSSARVLSNKLFSRPFLISCLPARRFRVRLVWLSIGVSCSFKQMLVVLRGATSTLNASQRVHDSVNSVHDHDSAPPACQSFAILLKTATDLGWFPTPDKHHRWRPSCEDHWGCACAMQMISRPLRVSRSRRLRTKPVTKVDLTWPNQTVQHSPTKSKRSTWLKRLRETMDVVPPEVKLEPFGFSMDTLEVLKTVSTLEPTGPKMQAFLILLGF